MERPAQQQGSSRRTRRGTAWVALLAMASLAALLVPDALALALHPPEVRASGNDYLSILASQRRNQVVNFVIGAALHDGVGPVTEVVVPRDLASLSARPGDQMIAGSQPALQMRRLTRLVPGRFVQADYDPRIATGTVDAWSASSRFRLSAYPSDVFLLRAPAPSDGRWALLTDGARLRIFIVPLSDAPAGVTLP